MKLFSLLAACTVPMGWFGLTTTHAQTQALASSNTAPHKWIFPLPPDELLKLLPSAPDQWEMKQSTAKNFAMDWVSSQAQREFDYTPPATPGAPSNPTQVLRITVTDTGYYAGLMGDFENFQAGGKGEAESLMLNGLPARHLMIGKTMERLRLLVKQRYVIQIDVQNEPAGSAQKWMGIIDLPKFAALPVGGDETPPRPLILSRIDELNPRNNSTSKAFWSAPDGADATSPRH